jgi:hypothetical protein
MITENGIVVIHTFWYTHQPRCIGIVYGRDKTTGEMKAYIGCVTANENGSEQDDINYITSCGARFPTDAAAVLMGYSRAVNKAAKPAQSVDSGL